MDIQGARRAVVGVGARWGEYRQRLRLPLRYGLAATAALGAIGITLVEHKRWQPPEVVQSWLYALALAAAFLLSVWDSTHETLRTRRRRRRENVRLLTRTVLVGVSALTKVSVDDVGVSVFFVKHGILPRLSRFHSERLLGTPAPSEVIWAKGKGVIGECWSANDTRVVYRDLRELANLYARRRPQTPEFEALRDRGLAMELDHEEFCQMIGKYGEVLAVRIHGRRPGVLAVDVAWDHYKPDDDSVPSGPVLRNDEVEKMLQRSASDLAKSLRTL